MNKPFLLLGGFVVAASSIVGVRVGTNSDPPETAPLVAPCMGNVVDGRVYAPAGPCQDGGLDFVVIDGLPSAPPGR